MTAGLDAVTYAAWRKIGDCAEILSNSDATHGTQEHGLCSRSMTDKREVMDSNPLPLWSENWKHSNVVWKHGQAIDKKSWKAPLEHSA